MVCYTEENTPLVDENTTGYVIRVLISHFPAPYLYNLLEYRLQIQRSELVCASLRGLLGTQISQGRDFDDYG